MSWRRGATKPTVRARRVSKRTLRKSMRAFARGEGNANYTSYRRIGCLELRLAGGASHGTRISFMLNAYGALELSCGLHPRSVKRHGMRLMDRSEGVATWVCPRCSHPVTYIRWRPGAQWVEDALEASSLEVDPLTLALLAVEVEALRGRELSYSRSWASTHVPEYARLLKLGQKRKVPSRGRRTARR